VPGVNRDAGQELREHGQPGDAEEGTRAARRGGRLAARPGAPQRERRVLREGGRRRGAPHARAERLVSWRSRHRGGADGRGPVHGGSRVGGDGETDRAHGRRPRPE
jgi:hypothetical protein